jgi:hypothetical protein
MKRYILLAFVVLIHAIAFSQPVDIEAAKKVSINLYKSRYQNGFLIKGKHVDVNASNVSIASSFTKKINGHNSYYVTNFTGGGWVITSSHSAVGPILAHSPTGSINENDKHSPMFDEWMKKYDIIIDHVYKNNINNTKNQAKWDSLANVTVSSSSSLKSFSTTASDGTSAFYLLSTQWNQDNPNDVLNSNIAAYNYLMPSMGCSTNGGKAVAGCGPVAVAQILKFWGYAEGNTSDFDWWNMPDHLNQFSTFPNVNPLYSTQVNAISYLLKICGDNNHLNANYGCSANGGTSTSDPNYGVAFRAFGYNSLVEHAGDNPPWYDPNRVNNKDEVSHADLLANLSTELVTYQRPILYCAPVFDYSSGNFIAGHAFVCDGYDASNQLFHFNFGWAGDQDGFYDCNDIYIYLNGATVDINVTNDHYMGDWFTQIYPTNWQPTETVTNVMVGVSPSTNNETWQASTILAAGNNTSVTIPSGNTARMIAAQSVNLQVGFSALAGSSFLARTYQNFTGGLKDYIETMNEPIATTPNESSEIALDENTSIAIDAYPNPITNANLTITASKTIIGKVIIELYDLLGVKVYASTEEGLSSKQINFGTFAKGIYLLKVSYNNSTVFNTKVFY